MIDGLRQPTINHGYDCQPSIMATTANHQSWLRQPTINHGYYCQPSIMATTANHVAMIDGWQS
jgi:aminoglycoside phosphotransferase